MILPRDKLILSRFGSNILEYINEHRPRSSASGDSKRSPDSISKLVDIAYLESALRYREHYARAVYLLKRILSYQALCNIARNKYHRG